MPLFTVFTPTYNRAKTLHRVYESLQQQTFRDFEWIIVDDGSTDDTKSIVDIWQKHSKFPIRYIWQQNGHKKSAFNHGVRLARGDLFLSADSDDRFSPTALERFIYHWIKIPEKERNNFAGVCGLCQDEQGNIVGTLFPGDWGIDSDSLEIYYRFAVRGEKWGFCRTDVLRAHPFPEHLPGHVPEGVIWTAIAARYKTRFVNEALRIYFRDAENRLTRPITPGHHAIGHLYWKRVVLSFEIRWFWRSPAHFAIEAARWTRFRLHLDGAQAQQDRFWPASLGGGLLVVFMAPLGVAWWLYDCWRRR